MDIRMKPGPLFVTGPVYASRLHCGRRNAPLRCSASPTFREQFAGRIPDWVCDRLEQLGFTTPTNVQSQALHALLGEDGSDVVIHAKTGSGKTLSYLVPIFARVDPARASLQAVVVVPTQELGMQVYRVARRIAAGWSMDASDKRFVVLPTLKQANLRRQKLMLREAAPRLIIGTVERIAELEESGRLNLGAVSTLVVDEFDACFAHHATTSLLRNALQQRATEVGEDRDARRRTILASATVPQHKHFLKTCVKERWTKPNVKHIWIDSGERVPSTIRHVYAVCDPKKKLLALKKILAATEPYGALVFVHESRDVAAIAAQLTEALNVNGPRERRVQALAISESSPLGLRKQAMKLFRRGEAQVLIATDVAARGLDVPHITHVFNVDLPPDPDTYLHRAGRTGRLGRHGTVCSICGPNELFVLDRVSNALNIELQRMQNKELKARPS